jgi:hypothetical protein
MFFYKFCRMPGRPSLPESVPGGGTIDGSFEGSLTMIGERTRQFRVMENSPQKLFGILK